VSWKKEENEIGKLGKKKREEGEEREGYEEVERGEKGEDVTGAGAEGGGGGGQGTDGGDVQLRHHGRHQRRREPFQARRAGAAGFFVRSHAPTDKHNTFLGSSLILNTFINK